MKQISDSKELIIKPTIEPCANASLSAFLKDAAGNDLLTEIINRYNQKTIALELVKLGILNLCLSGYIQIDYYKERNYSLWGFIDYTNDIFEIYKTTDHTSTTDVLSTFILEELESQTKTKRLELRDLLERIVGFYLSKKNVYFPERNFVINYLQSCIEVIPEIKIGPANTWNKIWKIYTLQMDANLKTEVQESTKRLYEMRIEYRRKNLLFRNLLVEIENKLELVFRNYDINND